MFQMILRTSKGTIFSEKFGNAESAFDDATAKFAATENMSVSEAEVFLADLEIEGKLEESLLLDGKKVDAADYL